MQPLMATQAFLAMINSEQVHPIIACFQGLAVVHTTLPYLPEGIDLDDLPGWRHKGILRQ